MERGASLDRLRRRWTGFLDPDRVVFEPRTHGSELVGAFPRTRARGRKRWVRSISREPPVREPQDVPVVISDRESVRAEQPCVGSRTQECFGDRAKPLASEHGLLETLGGRQDLHPFLERFEEPTRL